MSFLVGLALLPRSLGAQTERLVPSALRILTHREQAPLVRSCIEKRFDVLLPELMRREGIDMWIVVSREHNSDPVFSSMAPLRDPRRLPGWKRSCRRRRKPIAT